MTAHPTPLRFQLLVVSLLLVGCGTSDPGPYNLPDGIARDPHRAEELAREAADYIDSDPERAESLLREALAADLFCGAAHNNLGVIHISQGNLYEAAHEFEWARKLMPGNPDPRLNLGLTLEKAGQATKAMDTYAAGLETSPEHVPTIQALARLLARTSRDDDRLPELLGTIQLRGETEDWRNWARQQSLRLQGRE